MDSLTRVPNPIVEPMIQGVSLPVLGPAEDEAVRRAMRWVELRWAARRAVNRVAVLNDMADALFTRIIGGLWLDVEETLEGGGME